MGVAQTVMPRDDVQAMRALAVGLVIANHIVPGQLRGGYIGVDVFYVISGLLITRLLVREAERTGRVRIGVRFGRRNVIPRVDVTRYFCSAPRATT